MKSEKNSMKYNLCRLNASDMRKLFVPSLIILLTVTFLFVFFNPQKPLKVLGKTNEQIWMERLGNDITFLSQEESRNFCKILNPKKWRYTINKKKETPTIYFGTIGDNAVFGFFENRNVITMDGKCYLVPSNDFELITEFLKK